MVLWYQTSQGRTRIEVPKTAFAFLVNAAGCLVLFNYLAVCIALLATLRRMLVFDKQGNLSTGE
jgi:hypothetical protein